MSPQSWKACFGHDFCKKTQNKTSSTAVSRHWWREEAEENIERDLLGGKNCAIPLTSPVEPKGHVVTRVGMNFHVLRVAIKGGNAPCLTRRLDTSDTVWVSPRRRRCRKLVCQEVGHCSCDVIGWGRDSSNWDKWKDCLFFWSGKSSVIHFVSMCETRTHSL